jgi:hypothetical protein
MKMPTASLLPLFFHDKISDPRKATLHIASSSRMKLTTFVFRLRKNEMPFRPFRGEGEVSSDMEDGQGGEDDKAV